MTAWMDGLGGEGVCVGAQPPPPGPTLPVPSPHLPLLFASRLKGQTLNATLCPCVCCQA